MSASSVVSPEFDSATITSADPIMPRSPWLASTGVDKLRGRAGRGQGRRDLAGDVTALADTGDDDAPERRRASLDGLAKRAVERVRQAFEPANFGSDDASGDGQIGLAARRSSRRCLVDDAITRHAHHGLL